MTTSEATTYPTGLSDAELAAMVAEADTGEDEDIDQAEEEGAPAGAKEPEGSKAAPVEQPAAAPAPAAAAAPIDEFDPRNVAVLTADGKHQIPYSAYDSARQRARQEAQGRQAAEEAARMERSQREIVERELADARTQLAAAQQPGAKAPTQEAVAGQLSDEQMEVLKDEAPAIYAAIKSTQDQLAALARQSEEAKTQATQTHETVMDERRAAVRAETEAAISNEPKIVHLRETDPDRYNALVDTDRFFLQQPAAQGLTIPQRIAKSLAMYEAQTKPIELPGIPTPATKTAASAPAPAAQAPAVPNTLSDISGGGLPATSELDNIDGLTQKQLTDKLSRMSQEDIFAYVGKMNL